MKLNVIEVANQVGFQQYVPNQLQAFANAVLEEAAKKAARMVNGKSIAAAIREMKS